MHYSIKHLHYCQALATHKSFSAAAKACNVTQSTLSLGIQELERQMDALLFERARGNVLPTAAGRLVLSHAAKILDISESLAAAITSRNGGGGAPIRVGVIPTIAPYLLPRFLPALETAFPQSPLRIAEDTTETIIAKIKNGDMDLGLLALPVDTDDLDTRVLFTEDFVLAFHKHRHPEFISGSKISKTLKQVQGDMTLEKLQNQELLLLREGHCLKDHILSACKLPPERQNQFFEAESLNTLLAMVNQGYGVTLLPEMAIQSGIEKSYPNIMVRKFTAPAPSRHIALIWRKTDIRRNDYLALDL